MKLAKIIELARIDLDDSIAPYLWSDQELINHANEAEAEACRRARLIIDSSTVACCNVAVTATNSLYALHASVIFVRRAKLALQDRPLGRASVRDVDANVANWETETGTPSHFISDYETGKVRLYAIPIANDTLKLTVVRLPLVEMDSLDDTPEVNARYHRSLRFWINYRAYMKNDSETKNEKKSLENLAYFEQEFGKKSSAVDEEWIEREQSSDPYDGTF